LFELPTEAEPVRVVCGDCLEVLPTLPDGCVDAVITDPPYGKGYHSGGVSAIPSEKWSAPKACPWDGVKIAGDDAPNADAIPHAFRLLREGGACYLFTQWMVETFWLNALQEAGFVVRNRLVWAKPFHGAGDLQTTYGPQHESILFATKGRHELNGKRHGDVWAEPVGANGCFRKGKVHPTEKPVALIRRFVGASVPPDGLILDPFAGSGTTGVAAISENRRAILIEKEPAYAEIARRRVREAMGTGLLAGV
jgi:DNA modification methylase